MGARARSFRGARASVLVLFGLVFFACAGGASARRLDFDTLPLLQPGQLVGRLVYLTRKDCQLRQYDLATGEQSPLGIAGLCASGAYPVLAPDGSRVAERDATVALNDRDGDPGADHRASEIAGSLPQPTPPLDGAQNALRRRNRAGGESHR
jgi:hypothetical protein